MVPATVSETEAPEIKIRGIAGSASVANAYGERALMKCARRRVLGGPACRNNDMIRAIVHTGEFTDPASEQAIGDIMI